LPDLADKRTDVARRFNIL